MLTRLFIQNIAVIQKASIDLAAGFNVLTGETGAGKTVLISSIDAVLGERTSKDIIRAGEEKAVVSAMFEDISPKVIKLLEDYGFADEDGCVLISREISVGGKNVCRINGMPATVSMLKEIASRLIHIHGQKDSGQLLQSEKHMELIDIFAENEADLADYQESYKSLKELQEKRSRLDMDNNEKAQRMDMLRYQIEEIESASLSDVNEEDDLISRRKMISGAEKIMDGLAAAYSALRGNDEQPGIISLMDDLSAGVEDAANFMDELSEMNTRISEMYYELEEFAGDIRESIDEFEFDPRELDVIENRLDTIFKLKRKYGSGIAEILEHYNQIVLELEDIDTNEQQIIAIDAQLKKAEKEAIKKAKTLSEKRLDYAKKFIALVEEELTFLDMPGVKLSIVHQIHPLRENGMDNIELFIVTNAGDQPKPLSKIASGGEISRIMLSIKNVLADKDDIQTLIFDEVDTGVSGRAAGKIGRKLREVSTTRQIICVTHLAQVAAYADTHFLIAKQESGGKTYTNVNRLSHEEAITELARITSGDHVTDTAVKSAAELWSIAHEE